MFLKSNRNRGWYMDDEKEILLREWEQRYESYRAYARQYLTGLSITVTGYAVALTILLSVSINPILRIIGLMVVIIALFGMFLGHRIIIPEYIRVGQRMDTLEEKLGIGKFGTVTPLIRVARVSMYLLVFVLVATLFLTVYLAVAGI